VVAVACVAAASVVRADAPAQPQPLQDAVALLPLDAEKRLEIYGQPVAAEIARALRAGGIEVVVVVAGMTVPERARLIVRGKIVAGKGDTVALSVQISDPRSGSVLDTQNSSAQPLTHIDRAAGELSGRVLDVVKKQLATQHEPVRPPERRDDRRAVDRPRQPQEPQPIDPALVFAIGGTRPDDPLRVALPDAIATWGRAHHFITRAGDAAVLAGAEFAITLDVREIVVDEGAVPRARARVRVRIARTEDGKVKDVFDRVVITDTIIGERGMATPALAARTAREVLAIATPHVRRVVPSWR
jgi:hypothetical protein